MLCEAVAAPCRSSGCRTDNGRVDLDKLTDVAEKVRAQQGCRWNLGIEPLIDGVPGPKQIVVRSYDMNREVTYVPELEPVEIDQGLEIVETLGRLAVRILAADEFAFGVEWNLTRNEESVIHDIGVAIAGCRCQAGCDFVIVHAGIFARQRRPHLSAPTCGGAPPLGVRRGRTPWL